MLIKRKEKVFLMMMCVGMSDLAKECGGGEWELYVNVLGGCPRYNLRA
jgi:hypothetical protein